ncbi:hypothetical protein J6590_006665 [Homalodisca vitripennis]|nr:hypothetical protein J6590_006665 [Homalodisca vitripennis]
MLPPAIVSQHQREGNTEAQWERAARSPDGRSGHLMQVCLRLAGAAEVCSHIPLLVSPTHVHRPSLDRVRHIHMCASASYYTRPRPF